MTNLGLTMTERVKKDRNRQNEMRNNRFAANRKIDVDVDSFAVTPAKPAPVKLSQIKDKPEKLKKYIEQKRTDKLKEKIEQRSPFIPYVPIGRWVERKEPLKKPKSFTISTPTRKALMSDGKILKKSTIKEIATTAMKENVTAKKSKKEEPIKSRKKILSEFNNVPEKEEKLTVEPVASLDDTFEIIPDQEDNLLDDSVIEVLSPEASPSPMPAIVLPQEKSELTGSDAIEENSAITTTPIKASPKQDEILQEIAITTTPVKIASPKQKQVPAKVNKESNKLKKEAKKPSAKIVVPVKRPTRETKPSKSVETKKVTVTKKKVVKSKSVQEQVTKSPIADVKAQEEVVVPKKAPSNTYKFYKSSLDNQVAYLRIHLNAYTRNLDSFINKLSEDMQNIAHQTIQQGNLLINDKMKNFEDLLEKFEYSSDPQNITEDDIENYWMLLFDQVEEFKSNLQSAQEVKLMAIKDDVKRRTRKTILGTPTRRSRRIAETVETPKHNAATCFGCTPLSSSKVNTPKSAKVRRTAFKKSIAFDEGSKN